MTLRPETPSEIEPYIQLGSNLSVLPEVARGPLQMPSILPFVLGRSMKGEAGKVPEDTGSYQHLGEYTILRLPFYERKNIEVNRDPLGRALQVVESEPKDIYPSIMHVRIAQGIFDLINGVASPVSADLVWHHKAISLRRSRQRLK